MTGNKKAALVGGRPENVHSVGAERESDYTTRARIKTAVVTLACWHWIPPIIAEFIIRHGGLRDA